MAIVRLLRRALRRRWVTLRGRWAPSGERPWRRPSAGGQSPWRLVATATSVGLALATVAVAVAGPWDAGRRRAERDRAAAWGGGAGERPGRPPARVPRAGPVLAALTQGDHQAGPPSRAKLAALLRPLWRDDGLGDARSAAVVDVATGRRLYASRADTAVAPASTVKLVTAAAALSALGPDHRIETRVLRGDGDGRPSVVLVGGGDPTLSASRLAELAEETAQALRPAGKDDDRPVKVAVRYDTRLYSGPRRHPIGDNPNIAPVSALMVNEGRLDDSGSGPAPRSRHPARDAAESFAAQLRKRGVRTVGEPAATKRRATGEELADTHSAPLSSLVERMLTHSDNDLGEALARQVAVARDAPASFRGAGRAVRAELARLRLPLAGVRFADGSGLNRANRVTAELLTRLLVRAAEPGRPELRPVLTGLPVAHFSGTLRDRYDDEGGDGPDTAPAAGRVRAKTGTLTGVTSLAGTVVDADGRLLAFAFLSADGSDRVAGHAALDRLAAALAGCGCR